MPVTVVIPANVDIPDIDNAVPTILLTFMSGVPLKPAAVPDVF